MSYRVLVLRPPTNRFGPTSWDLKDSHQKPCEFASAEEALGSVRLAVEQARYDDEPLTFKPYKVEP